jgi:hypothetical protein
MTYEIRVSGLIGADVLKDCGDLSIATTEASTALSGSVADQAALLGLLQRLRALGLDIVEVRRVLEGPETRSGKESS